MRQMEPEVANVGIIFSVIVLALLARAIYLYQ